MDKGTLEQWVCAAEPAPPAPAAIAAALGLPTAELADTTFLRVADRLRSLRFVLAVLHDAFASDADVGVWLTRRRKELGGMSARDALLTGRAADVEELAVKTWNKQATAAAA